MAINKAWHEAHRMPANAKLDQRIAWHLEHREMCGCRPVPASIAKAIDAREQVARR